MELVSQCTARLAAAAAVDLIRHCCDFAKKDVPEQRELTVILMVDLTAVDDVGLR